MIVNRSIPLNTFVSRIALLLPALVLLAAVVLVLRWGVANSAASQQTSVPIAELSTALAPSDPQTHYTLATLYEASFLPEDGEKALHSYEKAIDLSPYDYRFWLPYSKALERNGDIDAAEKALRRAVQVAPSYAQIHWALGNVLLRQGKTDEAFAEMRQAAETNVAFASTAAVTALQFSTDNPSVIAERLGNSSNIRSGMAIALARQKKFDDSISIWRSIPDDERNSTFKDDGNRLFSLLIGEKQFRHALLSRNPAAHIGEISNPDFEAELNISDPTPFEWQIAQGANPRIGFDDSQKHSGARSLGLIFAKNSGKDFRSVSQTVAVDGDTNYRVKVFVKTDIQTTGKLRVEIADAGTGEVLGATGDFPLVSGDWHEMEAVFKTQAQASGVIVRLVRAGCESCSIEGRVWLDDFSLEK